MPMYEDELAPEPWVWELVELAVRVAQDRLDDPRLCFVLADAADDEDTDVEDCRVLPCADEAAGRDVARERLALGSIVALVRREGDAVVIDAQSYEDEVAGRWTVPVVRRRLRGARLDFEAAEFPEWAPALGEPHDGMA